jgi:hypothetical protein
MNGRVYDYRLGRFLSVDPIISNPLSSQAINPYSYIGNNPLSGTDPTGYDVCPAGQADKCSGAKPEPSSKPYSMVQARKDGSIAGRGGDNVTVNGFDQNTQPGQAVIASAKSNGAPGQVAHGGCTTGTDCGGPRQTGQAEASRGSRESTVSASQPPPMLQAMAGALWRSGEWFIGGDMDGVAGLGYEISAGVFVNFDQPSNSGVFGSVTPTNGLNGGVGLQVGHVDGAIRGPFVSVDVNASPVGGTILFNDAGRLSGWSLSVGPGAGMSFGRGETSVYTVRDLGLDVKRGVEAVSQWVSPPFQALRFGGP